MEKKIFFNNKDFKLEGLINFNNNIEKGVVITHPHPLYGGDMYNIIVEIMSQVYYNKGYSTLRFNFRGVGNSQSSFDNGNGEQDDVMAAFEYLSENNIKSIDIAGYSFGTYVNAHFLQKNQNSQIQKQIKDAVMISPPVSFMDFIEIKIINQLKYVICGSFDEFANHEKLSNLVKNWNIDAILKIINGADHFYSGYHNELKSLLMNVIE